MNFTPLEAIADAVLFEGYILYPYRPSSLKNRQRWNFGTLYPRAFAEAQTPQEKSQFRAEVLLRASASTKLNARFRFLQLVAPQNQTGEDLWAQGFARSRTLEAVTLNQLVHGVVQNFDLSTLSDGERIDGAASFHAKPRFGRLNLRARPLHDDLYRLTATLSNESPAPATPTFSRHMVQDTAFTSAHLMLEMENGAFVSLLEPDPDAQEDARLCVQDGVFPVLAGKRTTHAHVLCSPIILYDYPEVAPESPGNFFDGTEMDEMLALRVLTLTDEEKAEMRRCDPHARAILERTATLPDEQLARVHGALRGLERINRNDISANTIGASAEAVDPIAQPFDPFSEHTPPAFVHVFGIELRRGDRVRLWPQKKADILDMEMEGKIAIIEAIEQDLENNLQFAVVLEDDPGRDLGLLRQAGHRFFFTPDEIEPVGLEVA